MNAPVRPLRVTLGDVGARRKAELERARTAPAPVPATAAPVDRRTALRETVGALRSRVVGHPHGKARDQLVAELVAAEHELAQINAAAKASGLVKVGPPRTIITSLLEILDRAQNEGFVRTDGEHGQMNEAATWLDENGGGNR